MEVDAGEYFALSRARATGVLAVVTSYRCMDLRMLAACCNAATQIFRTLEAFDAADGGALVARAKISS